MKVHVKIQRFNSEVDKAPYWSEHDVEAEPTDRVLDVLNQVKWFQDGSLAYRRSCAHGICGSDAMRINGRNRLACKVLVKDAGSKITVQPLMGLPIVKDLVVDMEGFFAKYRSIKPYLDQRRAGTGTRAIASRRRSTPASTTRPSVFCARPVPPRARRSGRPTANTSARRPSCRRTASCSTVAIEAGRNAWMFSATRWACGAVALRLTALRPVRAASTL